MEIFYIILIVTSWSKIIDVESISKVLAKTFCPKDTGYKYKKLIELGIYAVLELISLSILSRFVINYLI